MALDERTTLAIALFAGLDHDGVEGRKPLEQLGSIQEPCHLVMERAYEGESIRRVVWELGYIPTVHLRPLGKIQLDIMYFANATLACTF